jgi:tRNA (guanine37-N1)-methyltransferase
MNFDVMTLFPAMIDAITDESIIGRAKKAGLITVRTHNIRDYSLDKHKKVDDTPCGGGFGMLMSAPPICDCYEAVKKQQTGTSVCIYLSPKGKVLTQKKAKELLKYDNITLLCGHYEGIDQRVIDSVVDEEISIGDYVLTGGELPACILIDCVSRMIPGVLADASCFEDESIAAGLLEYPQYTRPIEYKGQRVPDVLLSGNHAEIEKWRLKKALEITKKNRPDLL